MLNGDVIQMVVSNKKKDDDCVSLFYFRICHFDNFETIYSFIQQITSKSQIFLSLTGSVLML